MKILIGAIALVLAAPIAAQSAPAADPHAEHKGMDHGKMDHGKSDCCKDGKMECCATSKDGSQKACCEHAKGQGKSSSGTHGQDHGGH